jgi:hypothetical protein
MDHLEVMIRSLRFVGSFTRIVPLVRQLALLELGSKPPQQINVFHVPWLTAHVVDIALLALNSKTATTNCF